MAKTPIINKNKKSPSGMNFFLNTIKYSVDNEDPLFGKYKAADKPKHNNKDSSGTPISERLPEPKFENVKLQEVEEEYKT